MDALIYVLNGTKRVRVAGHFPGSRVTLDKATRHNRSRSETVAHDQRGRKALGDPILSAPFPGALSSLVQGYRSTKPQHYEDLSPVDVSQDIGFMGRRVFALLTKL